MRCAKEALNLSDALLLAVTPVSVPGLTVARRYALNCTSKLVKTRISYFCACCNQLKGNISNWGINYFSKR